MHRKIDKSKKITILQPEIHFSSSDHKSLLHCMMNVIVVARWMRL